MSVKEGKSQNLVKLLRSPTIKCSLVMVERKVDLYTGQEMKEIKFPQVDHIIEIQIYAVAVKKIYDHVETTLLSDLKSCINSLENYNVTSRFINLKKRDAISEQLKLSRFSLRAGLLSRLSEVQMTGIVKAINSAAEAICSKLRRIGQEGVAGELEKIIDSFDIAADQEGVKTRSKQKLEESKKIKDVIKNESLVSVPRCKDGSLDMRAKCNQGKDKYKD